MRIFAVIFFTVCMCHPCIASEENADTIYFNNGRSVSGIISKEDAKTVELETDGGSTVISRTGIKNIYHAPADKLAELRDKWEKRRANLKSEEKISEESRKARLKAYGDWVEQSRRKAPLAHEEGEIPIKRDPQSQSVLVDVILNGEIKALLVVDTGASIIVLTKSIGDKLGLDLSNDKGTDILELRLAGGRVVKAKGITLKSVRIAGIEEKDVSCAVLLDNKGTPDFKDGLLGRSFLNRFNIKLDSKNMKMFLQKLN